MLSTHSSPASPLSCMFSTHTSPASPSPACFPPTPTPLPPLLHAFHPLQPRFPLSCMLSTHSSPASPSPACFPPTPAPLPPLLHAFHPLQPRFPLSCMLSTHSSPTSPSPACFPPTPAPLPPLLHAFHPLQPRFPLSCMLSTHSSLASPSPACFPPTPAPLPPLLHAFHPLQPRFPLSCMLSTHSSPAFPSPACFPPTPALGQFPPISLCSPPPHSMLSHFLDSCSWFQVHTALAIPPHDKMEWTSRGQFVKASPGEKNFSSVAINPSGKGSPWYGRCLVLFHYNKDGELRHGAYVEYYTEDKRLCPSTGCKRLLPTEGIDDYAVIDVDCILSLVHIVPSSSPFSAAAASTTEFPFARDAVPVAAASSAAGLRRPVKRPRDDCPRLTADQPVLGGSGSWVVRGGVVCGTERRRQSVAEQFQQQGESDRGQETEEEALLEALLLQEENRQQQQGAVGSRVQRVLWPHVGSESALPDDVLLKFNNEVPAFTQLAALSAPPPTQPAKPLPSPMPPQLAVLPGSAPRTGHSTPWCGVFAPCIEDFAVQRLVWPPVGPESAFPDGVLLGLCCEDPAFTEGTAFCAPLPTQPLAAPPTAMPPKLAALSGSAPCIGDSCTLQRVDWPRVGSESALPDDVLLGFCCEDPASAQRAALSVPPPTQPLAPLPSPLPSQAAALCASAPGSTSSCMAAVLAGSRWATQEQEYVDAGIDGSSTGSNSNTSDEALFLDMPVAHMLLTGSALTMPFESTQKLTGSALTMPLPSEPQQQVLAAPGTAGTAVLEWVVEQGGDGEAGSQLHRQQHFFTQEAMLAQCLELERILSLPPHKPLPQPIPKALPQTPLLSAPRQLPLAPGTTSALHTPSNPRGLHMRAPIQPRPAMLQQPFSPGALPSLCQPHAASVARHGRRSAM
ncbi:unnamed protein product [Closterium sp. Yama58-4]|nr:unnamed protein product [Closterium sp. Yama58-4]